jgi:hypothetical protein
MVDELERLRLTDPEGPNGPLGTMVKYIGNNAYGKTLERLDGLELVMAMECPPEFIHYRVESPEFDDVYCRMKEPFKRDYHRPQIGIFITAHVRLLVREAALQASEDFIYADTDCVVFSRPVDFLDVDPKRYGAWKQESDGDPSIYVAKKAYWSEKDNTRKAKGLRTKELQRADYEAWIAGRAPVQNQVQRQNFVKFMGDMYMFLENERTGTDVALSDQALLVGDRFYPITR